MANPKQTGKLSHTTNFNDQGNTFENNSVFLSENKASATSFPGAEELTNINWLGSSYSGADIKVVAHLYKPLASSNEEDALDTSIAEIQTTSGHLKNFINSFTASAGVVANRDRSDGGVQFILNLAGCSSDSSAARILLPRWYSAVKTESGLRKFRDGIVKFAEQYSKTLASLQEKRKNIEAIRNKSTNTVVLGNLQTISIQTYREKEAVRALGTSYVKGYTRGPRCIPATEKVLIQNRGYISISDVNPGDFVQSTNNSYNRVLGSFNQGQKECVRLSFANGYSLISSIDHPILTPFGWVEANKLNLKDNVCVAASSPVTDQDLDISDDMLKLIAFLTGDGLIQTYEYPERNKTKEHRISLSINNEEIATIGKEVETILNKYDIAFTDYQEDGCIARRISPCIKPGATDWRLRKYNELHQLLLKYNLYGKHSYNKFIPQEFITSLSKKQIITYLRHLFATDGGYVITKDLKGIEASYSSTSEELIDEIRILLSKLGINALKSKEHKIGKQGGCSNIISRHNSYKLIISDSFELYKFYKIVGIFGKDKKLEPYIGLLLSRSKKTLPIQSTNFIELIKIASKESKYPIKKLGTQFNLYNSKLKITIGRAYKIITLINNTSLNNKFNELLASLLEKPKDTEYQTLKLCKKENIGKLAVYDLEVENRHQFICNFIVVHNTIGGSMIFTLFNEHALAKLIRAMSGKGSIYGELDHDLSSYIADQLPPIDLTIVFANEYGSLSQMSIYGVEFVTDGMTMSIEDLLTESVSQFVARDVDVMTSKGNIRLSGQQKGMHFRSDGSMSDPTASDLIFTSKDAYVSYLERLGIRRTKVNI